MFIQQFQVLLICGNGLAVCGKRKKKKKTMRATVFFALVALCLAEKVELEICISSDCSSGCQKKKQRLG